MLWYVFYFLGVVGVVGGIGGVEGLEGLGVVGNCPKPDEVWSYADDPLRVTKEFNYSEFAGNTLYYELAYHDYTQKPACPNPTCITSRKIYNRSEYRIYDHFRLRCINRYYDVPLYFDETNINGYVMGYGWIPNIIVDFGPDYEWVIEFQCLKYFKGINVYSRVLGNETYLNYLYSILEQYRLNYTIHQVECSDY